MEYTSGVLYTTDQISQKGTDFEKYSMKAFNVIENKRCESFSIYLQ